MASFFVVWQFCRMLLLFALVGGECHYPELRKAMLKGFAFGLLLQATYVVQQKLGGVVQATGTMAHQNSLGMMTELALLPIMASMLAGDQRKVLLLGVGAAVLVIAGGGSRGTISFAGGGCAVLLLLSLVRGVTPSKMRILGLSAIALMLATPLAIATLKNRFGSSSVTTQDDQRPAFERAARAMANDNILGVGANLYVSTANTGGYAGRAGVAWNVANRSAPVHNAYLLARAETGWLGEIGFILLLSVPICAGLRHAFVTRRGSSGEISLGSAVALSVNALHNNYEFASLTYFVETLIIVNIAFIAAELKGIRSAGSIRATARPQRL